MRPTPVQVFAEWVEGEAVGFAPEAVISDFALDSNSVKPGDLFLAIRGERVDGHSFIPSVLASGAVGSLVERASPEPYILVPNLVDALAKLASHFRSNFRGPVIGITGSAGKTTTKEFIGSAIRSLGPILITMGNRNTEYTVPLLWADLDPGHQAAVVEMSMRGFGQIRHLAEFSKPTVAVVTNIGYAHMLQVGSRQGIADAKGELLEQLTKDGIAILWHEDDYLESLKSKTDARILTFGALEGADCRFTEYHPLSWNTAKVAGDCLGHRWEAEIPAVGRHIALNAAAAISTAFALGIDPGLAAKELVHTQLPPMRMEIVEFQGGHVLLDTYNASPPSMIAAIETLSELPVQGHRLAVIGEMKELGEFTDAAHESVGKSLAASQIEQVMFYGSATEISLASALRSGMRKESLSMATSIDDVKQFLSQVEPGDAVLIKGSRSLELERALDLGGTH